MIVEIIRNLTLIKLQKIRLLTHKKCAYFSLCFTFLDSVTNLHFMNKYIKYLMLLKTAISKIINRIS